MQTMIPDLSRRQQQYSLPSLSSLYATSVSTPPDISSGENLVPQAMLPPPVSVNMHSSAIGTLPFFLSRETTKTTVVDKDRRHGHYDQTPSKGGGEGDNIILKTDGYKFSHHKQMPISWLPKKMRPVLTPSSSPITPSSEHDDEQPKPPLLRFGPDGASRIRAIHPSPSGEGFLTIVTDVSSVTVTKIDESASRENVGTVGQTRPILTWSGEEMMCYSAVDSIPGVIELHLYGEKIMFYNIDTSKERPGSQLMTETSRYQGAYNVSYFTPRAYEDDFAEIGLGEQDEAIVFFGLNYLIKRHLEGRRVTKEHVEEAAEHVAKYMADVTKDGRAGYDYSLFPHGDWYAIATGCYDEPGMPTPGAQPGVLPICIEALPEGSLVTPKLPCFKLTNTHPRFFWLPNYLETLLVQVWYPMTVATQTREIRRQLMAYSVHTKRFKAEDCVQKPDRSNLKEYEKVDTDMCFDLLDFGYRGVSSYETAGIGSLSYYTSGFQGSDTVAGVEFGKAYYDKNDTFSNRFDMHKATSVPAAEHSTVTSWVQIDKNKEDEAEKAELDSFVNFMRVYEHSFAVSLVSDGFNVWNAIVNQWGHEKMINKLKKRVSGRKLTLFRPDSGEGVEALPQYVKLLMKHVATKVSTALKEASSEKASPTSDNPEKKQTFADAGAAGLRVLQGDGVSLKTLHVMLASVVANGFDVSTVHFGSGGGLLQKVNRDSLSCAFKCCAMHVPSSDGSIKTFGIGKKPIAGGKTSFVGDPIVEEVRVENVGLRKKALENDKIEGANFVPPLKRAGKETGGMLQIVFCNGAIVDNREPSFDQILQNAAVTSEHLKKSLEKASAFLSADRIAAFQRFCSKEAIAKREAEAELGTKHGIYDDEQMMQQMNSLDKNTRRARKKAVVEALSATKFNKKDFENAWELGTKEAGEGVPAVLGL